MAETFAGLWRGIYGRRLALITELSIELENGERLVVSSNGSWKGTDRGPIRSADLLFVLLLFLGSIAIHSAHEVYTTLLVAVAIGTLSAFLLIEPTTTRATDAAAIDFTGRNSVPV